MRKSILLCLSFLLFLIPSTVFAQMTAKGTVTDAKTGNPVPNATVVVKATSSGTATEGDGSFVLQVTKNNAVLVISAVGYKTQEAAAGTSMSIRLQPAEAASLDEIVVVGYGTKIKKI